MAEVISVNVGKVAGGVLGRHRPHGHGQAAGERTGARGPLGLVGYDVGDTKHHGGLRPGGLRLRPRGPRLGALEELGREIRDGELAEVAITEVSECENDAEAGEVRGKSVNANGAGGAR